MGQKQPAAPKKMCVWKVGAFLSEHQEQVTATFSDESLTPVVLPHNICHLLTAESPSVHINACTYLLAYFTQEGVHTCVRVCLVSGSGGETEAG